MSINMNLTMEQKQLLSQSQIQSLELLAMCNVELSAFLNKEYLENPLLDHDDTGDNMGNTEDFHVLYERHQTMNEGYGHADRTEERPREIIPASTGIGIEDYLKEQLDAKRYTAEEWNVIEFLIMNLDDNGFYTMSVEETANMVKAPAELVGECLEDLRQLEPFGIFAENLSACLLRQLEVMGVEDENLVEIIRSHLEDASLGKISNITRKLGISSVSVRKYIAFIGTLNPRPLSGFYTGNNSYVVPDIIFNRKGDQWDISLNDNWIGNYHLNDYYLRMIAESKDPQLQEYFKTKLERARFIMSSIEQRRKTVLEIAGAVLEWQKDYFEGKADPRPMTMTDVAEKLGIHPSTVSRATSGKYIQYPRGTVLMKELFSAAVSSGESSESLTASQIKKMIKELIEGENKKKPYSDQALVKLLEEKGVKLSRRGAAKYREEMGIRGSFERKEVL